MVVGSDPDGLGLQRTNDNKTRHLLKWAVTLFHDLQLQRTINHEAHNLQKKMTLFHGL